METMKEDIGLSIGLFFGPNAQKVERIIEDLNKLMPRIDEVLDKPIDTDNPHYCCGDCLESIEGRLADLLKDIKYYERVLRAKVASWEKYPAEDDDCCRIGYISGFMDAFKNN